MEKGGIQTDTHRIPPKKWEARRHDIIGGTMTTINTIEDLFKLLDENPQWTEALRARLLTRELIELPEKFAQFAVATTQRFDRLEAEMDRRFAEVDQQFDRVEAYVDRRFTQVDQRFDRVEANINSIRDDLGILKGAHAGNSARAAADAIALDMGFELLRVLTQGDLVVMLRSQDISDIPPNERASFREADLVMEVKDGDNKTCYIVLEASFTVNGRDTRRAVRNAGFLTRFTGRPAYPAVAGMYRDDRVAEIIEAGEVYWHQFYRSDMEAE